MTFMHSRSLIVSLFLGAALLVPVPGFADDANDALLYSNAYIQINGNPSVTIYEGDSLQLDITVTTVPRKGKMAIFLAMTPKSASLIGGSGSDADNIVTGITPGPEFQEQSNYPFTTPPFPIFYVQTGTADHDKDYYSWQYTLNIDWYIDTSDGMTEKGTASWTENIKVVDTPEPSTLLLLSSGLLGLTGLSPKRWRVRGDQHRARRVA